MMIFSVSVIVTTAGTLSKQNKIWSNLMTNEQIIELVKEHFEEWEADEDGYCWIEFAGKPAAFLKFARALAEGYKASARA